MLAKKKKEVNNFMAPLVDLLAKAGLHPNHLTIAGLCLGFVAFFISFINYWLGVALFSLSFLIDLFDGALARETKKVSKFGAFLDSVSDKIVETLFIAFIAVSSGMQTIALFAVGFSIMISYVKHRAECLGACAKHSIFDRAERLIYTVVMMLILPFLPSAIPMLFTAYVALSATAIIQLVIYIKKQLI